MRLRERKRCLPGELHGPERGVRGELGEGTGREVSGGQITSAKPKSTALLQLTDDGAQTGLRGGGGGCSLEV